MLTYRLRITRMEPNEQFAVELKQYEERRSYSQPGYPMYSESVPVREHEITTLETVITPAEWEIIKCALIKHWDVNNASH